MDRPQILMALAVGAMALYGCATDEARWSNEVVDLVVYGKQIPLYPGSVADNAMGSDSYGDEPDSHSEGMTVWFKVPEYDKEKVLAWYQERLPDAVREVTEEGDVKLTMTPAGGEPGEEVGVYIESDGFRVFEHTKPGKHRDS